MVLKCKICGGDLSFQPGDRIATCEYCGRQQTLPNVNIDERIAVLYERANGYRIENEFDKAANIYNQIIAENTRDSEAYWNLALCNYGVVYVKDPKTEEYVPTCSRTHYLSILNDDNYKKAIQYASPEQSVLYEKDARYIDDVQKGILDIAKHEKPFDIFICYKETDAIGQRTKDSIEAQNLYEKLTEQGYKVFFSRITLESKIGTEYEPYIYAALASSKVMIHITSSKENSEAVWVKNEWSRYLSLATKDTSKTFIPIYFNMRKDELPEEFANITSYDMQKDGFQQELIRGIKKLIPTPVMKLQRRKKKRKILGIASLILSVILIIGTVCTIPKIKEYQTQKAEYEFAMQLYYDKEYPEATWAFESMGDFKNSKEMKLTAEKSWRYSLATPVIAARLDLINGDISGIYYVTANGTADDFDGLSGTLHNGIDIGEHGKIVSLEAAEPLYALHEDGYVTNAVQNNSLQDDAQWHNIIKISPIFNFTNIALRADGKMLYGTTTSAEYTGDDSWLKALDSWDNIVDFDCYIQRGGGTVEHAIIVGIKADGSLCAVSYVDDAGDIKASDMTDVVAQFSNVTKVAAKFDYETLKIIALTKDGKMQKYIDSSFSEEDAVDICDVEIGDNICLLNNNGDLIDYEKGKVLESDIIYIEDIFAVTRTGSVYINDSNVKTRVYDEWTERLK